MYEEFQSLILDVRGLNDVKALEVAVKAEEAAVQQSAETHRRASKGIYDFADAYDLVEEKIEKVIVSAPKAAAAMNATATATARATATSTEGVRNYGQAALAASYAFQDFTSTQGSFAQQLSSIQNNIPSLVMAIGGPGTAGLAGAISAVSVGLGIALPKIADWIGEMEIFKKAATEATDAIGKLEDRIKAIENDPVKLAVDMLELDQAKAKLDQLKKDQAAFNALKEGKTVFEKEAGDQFRENFEQSGQEGVRAKDAIAAAITTEKNAGSPTIAAEDPARAEVARLKDISARIVDRTSRQFRLNEQAIVEAEKKLAKIVEDAKNVRRENAAAAQRETGAMFQAAFDGNDKAARDQLMNRLRSTGNENLANALAASTPEEMERQNDIANAEQASDDKWFGPNGGKARRQLKAKQVADLDADNARNSEAGLKWLKDKKERDRQQAARDQEQELRDAEQRQKEADARRKELETGLGDDFIAFGQRRMLEIGQMPNKSRAGAIAAFNDQFQRAANQRLIRGGMDPGRAAELANDAVQFTGQDLDRQLRQLAAGQGRGLSPQQLRAALFDILNQGGGGGGGSQAAGPVRARGGGGGFRSVPPTAPGAGKPAAAPQASGGGGGDAVVQAFGRMTDLVRAGDAINAEHIKQIYQALSQVEMALKRIGGEIAHTQRRAFQDNDSFLPAHW